MKFWTLSTFLTVSLLVFSGCVGAKPSPKKEPVIDTTLQVVELTKNGVIADMNAIGFEWKNITDPRVKGVYVYKAKQNIKNEKPSYYATVGNRFATHYVDSQITPDTTYTYYFKTFSDKAESEKSKLLSISSLPVLESVSWIYSVPGMPRSAKILWRPHTNQKVKTYVIERNSKDEPEWKKVAAIDGRLHAEYIDEDLKDNHIYKYRIRVVTFDNITSTPSEIVKVITKALPKPVQTVIVSKDLPKIITLQWDKSTLEDFAHFNIYKSDSANGTYEHIVQTNKNSYVDEVNEDGVTYYYRITVVDKDGLESKYGKKPIVGTTLPKPKAPKNVNAKIANTKVKISWSKVDPRSQSYIVVKSYKVGWLDRVTKEFKNITTQEFVDAGVEAGVTYTYTVYAVDKNNIISNPSKEVTIEVTEDALLKSAQTAIKAQSKTSQQKVKKAVVAEPKEKAQEVIVPTQDFELNEI